MSATGRKRTLRADGGEPSIASRAAAPCMHPNDGYCRTLANAVSVLDRAALRTGKVPGGYSRASP
jgi:hypothetical protein